MSELDEAREAVARILLERMPPEPMRDGTRRAPSWDHEPDRRGALSSADDFLTKLKETHAVVPRVASEGMHRAGMEVRSMQDNLSKAHNVIIDTSEIYAAMIQQYEKEG